MAKAKPWWQSKTKVGSLILALGAGLAAPEVSAQVPQLAAWAPLLQMLGISLTGIGVRDALP